MLICIPEWANNGGATQKSSVTRRPEELKKHLALPAFRVGLVCFAETDHREVHQAGNAYQYGRVQHLRSADGVGLRTPIGVSWGGRVCERRRRRWFLRSSCEHDGGILVIVTELVASAQGDFTGAIADLCRILSVCSQRSATRKFATPLAGGGSRMHQPGTKVEPFIFLQDKTTNIPSFLRKQE